MGLRMGVVPRTGPHPTLRGLDIRAAPLHRAADMAPAAMAGRLVRRST